jgi:hypothetical protein
MDEMKRRRWAADNLAGGPGNWRQAWREAIMAGEAPLPQDENSSLLGWTGLGIAFAVIVLCFLALVISPLFAQPRTSTQTATGITCNAAVVYDASTSGSTQLVAADPNGASVYVCGYAFLASGTVNVELDYGTGTACATGTKKIIPAYQFTAQTGMSDQSPIFRGLYAPSGTALCIKTSGGVAVQAVVYYAQF